MNKRCGSILLTVFIGAQLAAPVLAASEPVPSTGINGFFSGIAQKAVNQWQLENSLLEPVYQQSPLHWHARNVAYVSLGIMAAYTTYRVLKWGLSKIGLVHK